MPQNQQQNRQDFSYSFLNKPCLPQKSEVAQSWQDDAASLLPEDATAAHILLLAAIFYASPHLHQLARRLHKTNPDDLINALNGQITETIDEAYHEFCQQLTGPQSLDEEQLMAAIRQFRYRCYFSLALAELSGHLPIHEQAKQLSLCATRALQEVLAYLCARRDVDLSSIVILGMGKLGANELNYSSDIDLIILYDAHQSRGRSQDYVQLTRQLISLFQKQTADGFGWRVDLRLRPDPGATAIALSVDAAISYYESIARSWERAVYIRARPVAGNLSLGKAFLRAIHPFIWRRQLDYSILPDLKNWITHKPLSSDGLGFDVKRGAYGIRHIEMMTHLLQMLYGGKENKLQTHHTDLALHRLADLGYLSAEQAVACCADYWHWRLMEHRLQYCRDSHIYHLPTSAEEFQKCAHFMGVADSQSLYEHITHLQKKTEQDASHVIIQDMIEAHLGEREHHSWPADTDSQHRFLSSYGFQRPQDIIDIIDSWMSGRYPATRSERARHTLQELLPLLIQELANADDIDSHFIGFSHFLEALPSGVQFFTLLQHHPKLIQLITGMCLSAPNLMQELTKQPHIFEQMLLSDFFLPLTEHDDFHQTLSARLGQKDTEVQLDEVRRFAREAKFRAAAHIVTYPETVIEAAGYLSDLADACLAHSFAITYEAFITKHGIIADSHFAIVLLGRAGKGQLTPQSDIDAIFIYDGDTEAWSDGPHPLSCRHYYQRLARRFISWTGAQTASGALYQIDTRLRPDGQAGPLATHISGWQTYLKDKAWPFEKLALEKARILPLTSQNRLNRKIEEVLKASLSETIGREALRDDIRLLRDKLHSGSSNQYSADSFDFKKQPGGMIDCEFLYHLTGKMPALYEILNHLSILGAVIKPHHHSSSVPPALFCKEFCRLTQTGDYEAAKAALMSLRQQVVSQLETALTL